MASTPQVAVIMGSQSDREVVSQAARTLESLGVPHEVRVLSAHRTPQELAEYVAAAAGRGIEVFIAAAGGAAHLAGAIAAQTTLPVLGVPLASGGLGGLDALLSTVQMPAGVPVGTFAIGQPGAVNAALFATAILAGKHPAYRDVLEQDRQERAQKVLADPGPRS